MKRGHDALRDSDVLLANAAWRGVVVEPVLAPADDQQMRPQLQADWMARGVWESGRVAFFDNRIVDADAPCYSAAHLSWEAVSNKAAAEKKRKYGTTVEELRASITPLVCSTDGALHREYDAFQKRLASRLAEKWDKPYSVVRGWVKTKTQFAIMHQVSGPLTTRHSAKDLRSGSGAAFGLASY